MADNTNAGNEVDILVNITGNADSLNAAIKKAEDGIDKLDNKDVGANNVKSLKAQLKEATAAAVQLQLAGQENTQEYRTQVAIIAELRDQQDVLNRTVSAFDPGNKFNAFIGIAKSASTAVQGYTGALAFLGVEGENAAETMAKLNGIMAFTDALNGLGDVQDYFKGFVATIKSSIGTLKGAELASKAFGAALKGIGIGLIIAAVAYLVTNFDDLKEEFSDLIPQGINLGKTFDTLKAVFMGVGSAVLRFIIAPIKAVIDLLNGEFKKAMQDLKDGADVVGNFEKGYQQTRYKQAQDAAAELAKVQVEESEFRLKTLRQGSAEALKEEAKLAELRIKAATNEKDLKKALQDQEILFAQRRNKAEEEAEKEADRRAKEADQKAKAAAEKRAAERKAALEEIKKNNDEANAAIANSNDTARDKELTASQAAFEKRLALARKFAQDTTAITEAYALEQKNINEKYDKAINDAVTDRTDKTLDAYATRAKEINKFYDNLILTATDAQKKLLETQRQNELIALGKDKELSTVAMRAELDLSVTTSVNQADTEDTPQEAYQKLANIRAAELEAENTAFALKLEQTKTNNDEIVKLQSDHNAKLVDIERQRVDAVKALQEAEKKARLDAIGVGANALSAFGDLAGEQTVAGKALAVASATAATYLSAVQSYASASAIPVYGYIAGPIAAAAAIASGLANVRNILKVQVPGYGSGGGSISAPSLASATAPVISASEAVQNTNVQDVRVTNPDGQIIQAYISDKDLQNQQQRADFLNSIGTI